MTIPFNRHNALGFCEFAVDRQMPPWAFTGKPILHVGPGVKEIIGAETLDWPDWNAETDVIPFPENWFGGIVATHFMEHLANPLNFLAESARALRPGAALTMATPHGQSLAFLQDLDHKTPYVIDTWKTLLENPYYEKGNPHKLPFRIGANFLWGLNERNLMVVTQLIKEQT